MISRLKGATRRYFLQILASYSRNFSKKGDVNLVNLHYENLPDLGMPPGILMTKVHYEFDPYRRYLGRAKKVMQELDRLDRVKWKKTDEPILGERRGLDTGQSDLIYPNTAMWVLIEESERGKLDYDVVERFCQGRYVISISDQKEREHIKILDFNSNIGALLLERLPGGDSLLYLPANDHILNQQLRAFDMLQDTPEPHHRALLRLSEDPEKSGWPDFTPSAVESWEFLDSLAMPGTPEQRRFVEIALATPDFAILEGPPGSGKTTTICEIIIQEIRKQHRVLLCASTHIAVDNVLEALYDHGSTDKDVVAVRIGDFLKISNKAKQFQLQVREETERQDLIRKLEAIRSRSKSQKHLLEALLNQTEDNKGIITRIILESSNLVCGTTIGILQHPDIKDKGEKIVFDCLILDEASKTTFQEFLVPAVYAKKWILVGDVNQLSPFVEEREVEASIESLIQKQDAAVCLDVFRCWRNSRNRIHGLLVHNPDQPDLYLEQSKSLGVTSVDISLSKGIKPVEILGTQLLVGSGDLESFERFIHPDVEIISDHPLPSQVVRRHDYWKEKFGNSIQDYASEGRLIVDWSSEISWRIDRAFQLRKLAERPEIYKNEIGNLLPQWYAKENLQQIKHNIELIKRIALPSILELIQEGFERREGSKWGSYLTDGIPEDSLEQRRVRLSFQHRMHPDISRFPREQFYDSKSLMNPKGMAANREWTYPRYRTDRCGWIHVVGERSKFDDINHAEVKVVIDELKAFLEWSKDNRSKNSKANPHPYWSVAILTFYRRQEALLQRALQNLFQTNSRTDFRAFDGSVRITLCTVDRFQGHEADLVLLSFTRKKRVGFLDSPNRLNVALTRARYQLVLIGDMTLFQKSRSKHLRELATTLTRLMISLR